MPIGSGTSYPGYVFLDLYDDCSALISSRTIWNPNLILANPQNGKRNSLDRQITCFLAFSLFLPPSTRTHSILVYSSTFAHMLDSVFTGLFRSSGPFISPTGRTTARRQQRGRRRSRPRADGSRSSIPRSDTTTTCRPHLWARRRRRRCLTLGQSCGRMRCFDIFGKTSSCLCTRTEASPSARSLCASVGRSLIHTSILLPQLPSDPGPISLPPTHRPDLSRFRCDQR